MSGTLTNGIITSDVQHGTKLDKSDMKAVVAIAEPIISALDYAAFDPFINDDGSDGTQNQVSFADNPNHNRDAYIQWGGMVAKWEKAVINSNVYYMKLQTQIYDEKSRNPASPDTKYQEDQQVKAEAAGKNAAVMATAFEIIFETITPFVWTGASDYQTIIDKLFSGTATNKQQRSAVTTKVAKARLANLLAEEPVAEEAVAEEAVAAE